LDLWTTGRLARVSGLAKSRIRQLLIADEELHGFKPEGSRDWLVEDEEAKRWLKSRGIEIGSEVSE
jgi:hypothetical protein